MLCDPNRTILQARLVAYNTALGREVASHLQGWSAAPPSSITLGLIDELLRYWEENHGSAKATP